MELKYWDKIENYLFEKYCVEGFDPELERLMEEHDRNVRDDVVSKFASAEPSSIVEHMSSGQKDDAYRMLWADQVEQDVKDRMEEIDVLLDDNSVLNVVHRYVYEREYDCNHSYWDNLDALIKNEYEMTHLESLDLYEENPDKEENREL